MTDPDITPEGIAKALEGVTEGPWAPIWDEHTEEISVCAQGAGGIEICVADSLELADAQFIAYAHNSLPLIAERMAQLEAKATEWENNDDMQGGVVDAIRRVLNESGVPEAAFIDDHVMNAIAQRDRAIADKEAAEKRVAELGAEIAVYQSASEIMIGTLVAISQCDHVVGAAEYASDALGAVESIKQEGR